MKKIIMLALVLTTIAATAFSHNTDAVNQKVLNSFSKAFKNAEDVHWDIKKDLCKATFKVSGQIMFAYYNQDGEQVALTRNILPAQLPLNLATELKSEYNNYNYWLTDLFEVSSNDETAYYATVENTSHIIIIKSDGASGWKLFKKEKKKA